MIDAIDCRLLTAVQGGLPIVSRPYAVIGEQLNLSESEVIARLQSLKFRGLIKRWGVVVNHRQLGYRANAMIVLDVADAEVDVIGQRLGQHSGVNLCYRRPRRPDWPYNLYCMIHGKSRERVMRLWAQIQTECKLEQAPYEVLFSERCFKQRGALYLQSLAEAAKLQPA